MFVAALDAEPGDEIYARCIAVRAWCGLAGEGVGLRSNAAAITIASANSPTIPASQAAPFKARSPRRSSSVSGPLSNISASRLVLKSCS